MSKDKRTFHKFKESVVVHFREKTYVIHKTDARYSKVVDLIDSNKLEQLDLLADHEAREEIRRLLGLKK